MYVMSKTALVRRRSDFSRERARSIDNCMDYQRARSNPTFVSKRFEFQSLSILGAKGCVVLSCRNGVPSYPLGLVGASLCVLL